MGTGNVFLLSKILSKDFFSKGGALKKILIFSIKVFFIYALIVVYCLYLPLKLNLIAFITGFNVVLVVLFIYVAVGQTGKYSKATHPDDIKSRKNQR